MGTITTIIATMMVRDIEDKDPNFYGMVTFGSKKWYVNKLEEQGLTDTTDWETFVKNKIGDLEQWIEENRPKN